MIIIKIFTTNSSLVFGPIDIPAEDECLRVHSKPLPSAPATPNKTVAFTGNQVKLKN